MKLSIKRAQTYLAEGRSVYITTAATRHRVSKLIAHKDGALIVFDLYGESTKYPAAPGGLKAAIRIDDGHPYTTTELA